MLQVSRDEVIWADAPKRRASFKAHNGDGNLLPSHLKEWIPY
jgi:hypothetical protein